MQLWVVTLLLTVSGAAFGQTQADPAFEVASVRQNKSGGGIGTYPARGGMFSQTNVPLALFIQNAYSVRRYQLSGAPDWIKATSYDITAKADGNPTRQQ